MKKWIKNNWMAALMGLFCLAVLLFLLLQDIAWTGRLEIKTDFLKFTPYFTVLKPQDRVKMSVVNEILIEPLHFDVYLPNYFDKAAVELEYKNPGKKEVLLGPSIKDGWDFKTLAEEIAKEDGFTIGKAEFDLADKNINSGKLRFTLSIPGYQPESDKIEVKGVKVVLTRKPLWRDNIVENVINYLLYVKNQF